MSVARLALDQFIHLETFAATHYLKLWNAYPAMMINDDKCDNKILYPPVHNMQNNVSEAAAAETSDW